MQNHALFNFRFYYHHYEIDFYLTQYIIFMRQNNMQIHELTSPVNGYVNK